MKTLFIEVRCEELPPSMVRPALDGLAAGLQGLLAGVAHGAVRTFATPRRLAVAIEAVAESKPLVERLVTGPPADKAFVNGAWTPGAVGFAKGKGKSADDLQLVEGPKGKVVAVMMTEGGEKTVDLVRAGLEAVVRAVPFHKTMEWGNGGLRWGRPISSIAGLYGEDVIGGDVAGYAVSNVTEGHRYADDTRFSFHSVEGWLDGLRKRNVEPDLQVRAGQIRALLDQAAHVERADRVVDEALEEQVLHLVEWPVLSLCSFDEDLLELPPRLLIESMKVNQRYFPILRHGRLTNRFVAVSNSPAADPSLVAQGFGRVLRARFADAKFFLYEDKKQPLASYSDGLARMRWIKGLGTMAQKQARVAEFAGDLASGTFVAGLSAESATVARRAGDLCKADLLTRMVNEFPELQGHVGRLYAEAGGEAPEVAIAVEEHYLPRFAGDAVASTRAGMVLAIADRVDTLVGCFGIGLAPKGGGDPQGLRRAALAVVNTVVAHESAVDLADLFRKAVHAFDRMVRPEVGIEGWKNTRQRGEGITGEAELVRELTEFAIARFEAQAIASGVPGDVVAAVLGGETRPLVLHKKLEALRRFAGTPEFLPILQTFKRILNISAKAEGNSSDRAWTQSEEAALDAAFSETEVGIRDAIGRLEFAAALSAMAGLQAPVAAFFDAVLVDDPDPATKARRVGLLQRISGLFREVADFSRISTR